MLLRKLTVHGFGRFGSAKQPFEVEFRPGLNLIVGPNESGKSTLQTCILWTLFGGPRQAKNRFPPLAGGPHRSELVVELSDGATFRVQRDFARTASGTPTISREAPEGPVPLGEREWQEILKAGLGTAERTNFERSACMAQGDLLTYARRTDQTERREYALMQQAIEARLSGSAVEQTTRSAIGLLDKRLDALRMGERDRAPRRLEEQRVRVSELRRQKDDAARAVADARRQAEKVGELSHQLQAAAEDLAVKRNLLEHYQAWHAASTSAGEARRQAQALAGDLHLLRERRQELEALAQQKAKLPAALEGLAPSRDDIVQLRTRLEDRRADRERVAQRIASAEREMQDWKRKAELADVLEELNRVRQQQSQRARLIAYGAISAFLGLGLALVGMFSGRPVATGAGGVAIVAGLVMLVAGLRRGELRERLSELEAKATQTCSELGMPPEEIPQPSEAQAGLRSSEAQLVRLRGEAKALGDEIEALTKTEGDYLGQTGVACLEALVQQIDQFREIEQQRERAEEAIQSVLRGRAEAELVEQHMKLAADAIGYDQVISEARQRIDPSGALNDRQLAEHQEQTRREVERLEKRRQELQSELEQAKAAALYLARDAPDPVPLSERLAVEEERLQAIEREVASLELARETLARIAAEMEKQVEAPVRERATDVFRTLVAGRYQELTGKELDLRPLSPETGEPIPMDALSYGTLEQLAFAVRYALAEVLLGGTPSLLILDDPFGSYDAERLELTLQFVIGAAENSQILLFTHDERYADRLRDAAHVIRLE